MKDKWNMTFLLFQSNIFFLILGLMEPDFYLTSQRKQHHSTGIAQNVYFDILICVFPARIEFINSDLVANPT